MKQNTYLGSCLCKTVLFEITGEFEHFFLCHCSRCQKGTGSAHAANLFSTTAKLTWLSGTNAIKTFRYPNTRHIKSFCSHCGSALPNIQEESKLLMVPAGSLDNNVHNVAEGHIFCKSRANWDRDLHNAPEFDELPDNKK